MSRNLCRHPKSSPPPIHRGIFLAAVLAAAMLARASLAQTPAPDQPTPKPLAFEVVSIRPDPTGDAAHGQVRVTPDGWHMAHSTFLAALLTAYVPTADAMMFTTGTLVGVPDWMRSDLYDIDARVPDSDLARWQNPATQPAMLRTMVQAMLADRCHLAVHRGSKVVTVYLLVIGKNGPKLKPSESKEPHPGAVPLPVGGEFLPNDGTGRAAFYAAPMGALAVVLSNFAGRPVEDRTGLTGRYDMSFRRPRVGASSLEPESTPNPPPSIFEVAESFGLKLESAKRPVETLVVDHADPPTPN